MKYVSTFKNRLIYIFRINDIAHMGCVKIGEATAPDGLAFQPNCKELNDAAKKRINSYTQTAGIKYELLYTEMTAYVKGGQVSSFNDKQVHDLLLRSGIKKKNFDISGNAQEWFCCDLETAKKAIEAVKNGQNCLDTNQKSKGKSPVTFRPEQLHAIEQTKRVLKKGNKMLWNAKMRMGKTITSLEVVKQMKFKRTIIVTHRPVVIHGWREDFYKIFYENDTPWIFGSREISEKSIAELESSGKNYVYFASLQDLRGSKNVGGKYDKNEDVFNVTWDLVIIDEAHEGTQTDKGQSVQERLTKENTKVINLSGTPFNLLEGGEYDNSNTFTWDYVMEQQAKQEWAKQHPSEYNPYEELPRLNILTFNLGELATKYIDDDKAFNFSEFFRINESTDDFVHKAEVASFLDIISSEKSESLYPFSSHEYREYFHHTFWIVPGVKEGKALTEMLRSHRVFGSYNIVNVCGKEDEEATDEPLDDVRRAIGKHPEDTYTITLSCGKLTTGVTVREWTAVLYLAGSKSTSPAAYMQTIFRVQSPGYIGGRMKTECYVFDFAPDRTLKMAAAAANVSAKAGEGNSDDKQMLGDFLNFCPIIACDGTEMHKYKVDQMMQQLKRVYVDKVVSTGFEDGHLYSKRLLNMSDIDLDSFANLREIIGQTRAAQQTKEIPINNLGFDKAEIKKAQKEQKKKTGKLITPEEARQILEMQLKRKQRDIAVSILRGISIRMPLLLYGAKLESEEEDITLDRFVDLVDDQSWAEFMPQGVSKEKFAEYKKYYDEDIFAAAGHQIRQLALAADKLPITQRIQHITQIFDSFRNPDKETVLTPWRVVNMHMSDTLGGYCFYSQDFPRLADLNEPRLTDRGVVTQRLFENANVRILEINSKSGLYPLYIAYSVFRHRMRVMQESKRSLFKQISIEEEQHIWRDVLAENIFVICKTEMARSITQRTLAGFTNAKVNTHVYYDLLNQITNKKTEFVNRLLSGSIFSKIKNMRFDAIVGNPPYQEMDGGGNASAINIYNNFVDIARIITPNYISMIIPARWYAGGKGLDEFRASMLSDKHIEVMIDYPNPKDCFPNTNISGGVCYFLWNKDHNGICYYTNVVNGIKESSYRKLNENDIFVRYNKAITIIRKVITAPFLSISNIVYARNPFDLDSSIRGDNRKISNDDVKVYSSKGEGFLRKTDIKSNSDLVDKYKLSMGKVLSGHIGETDGSGQVKVIATLKAISPNEVTTDSYLIIGAFDNQEESQNIEFYFKTKFLRFLLLQSLVSMNISRGNFRFVPLQDFSSTSDIDWNKPVAEIDNQLYKKYNLTDEEINFVEGMIKPME